MILEKVVKNKFYVYTIFNTKNGKVYVGKAKDPDARWISHKSAAFSEKSEYAHLIHRAIIKYGVDNFDFSILQEFVNEKDALDAEKYWINFFRCNINKYGKDAGYNMTDGGEGISGFKHSEETKKKIGKAHEGIIHSDESRKKMSESHLGENNNNYGKQFSDEHKKKISDTRKEQGNFRDGLKHSEETKQKISVANKGKPKSEEHKKKLSEAKKNKGWKVVDGKRVWFDK